MDYRREIDGLRAVAVLPVICFHAGFEAFSGGFVGVDVFFVISGYLITSILLAEREAGLFSLVGFYERRARRILPALFVVLLACLPAAWLWLLPADMKEFSKSLVAVTAFASNIFFWRASGYFDTTAELKPLLHTWSLAVEEQYYVLFPAFLMLAWRLGKRGMSITLLLMALASLAAAQWGAANNPAANFYLLPTRGWELLVGALVAFYLGGGRTRDFGKPFTELGGAVGMLLIGYAIFAYDKQTPFPGLYALVPVIGAALIILFARPQTLTGSFLCNKALVGLGLISYSAYLWHQPLFAFARHASLSEPGKSLFGALIVIAIALAYLSWKYVEAPFRNKKQYSRESVFVLALVGGIGFASFGIAGYLREGFESRYPLPPNLVWESFGAKLKKQGEVCEPKPVFGYSGVLACDFGDADAGKVMLLYGDSHAQAISEELHKRFLAEKLRGRMVMLEGCETVPQIRRLPLIVNQKESCEQKFENLLSYIRASQSDIIVASRWSFRLYPISGEIEDMPARNSEGGREKEEYREYAALVDGRLAFDAGAKKAALERLVVGLLSVGARVYFVYPVPEISWDIARNNIVHYARTGVVLDEISIPYSDFLGRNRFVNQVLKGFELDKRFIPIKPETIFCDSFVKGRCVAQYGSVPFYYDDDHLSDVGARFIVDEIFARAGES